MAEIVPMQNSQSSTRRRKDSIIDNSKQPETVSVAFEELIYAAEAAADAWRERATNLETELAILKAENSKLVDKFADRHEPAILHPHLSGPGHTLMENIRKAEDELKELLVVRASVASVRASIKVQREDVETMIRSRCATLRSILLFREDNLIKIAKDVCLGKDVRLENQQQHLDKIISFLQENIASGWLAMEAYDANDMDRWNSRISGWLLTMQSWDIQYTPCEMDEFVSEFDPSIDRLLSCYGNVTVLQKSSTKAKYVGPKESLHGQHLPNVDENELRATANILDAEYLRATDDVRGRRLLDTENKRRMKERRSNENLAVKSAAMEKRSTQGTPVTGSAVEPTWNAVTAPTSLTIGLNNTNSGMLLSKKKRKFVYCRDFDKNGIMYWLGTSGHREDWLNPCLRGRVKVRSSSIYDGDESLIHHVVNRGNLEPGGDIPFRTRGVGSGDYIFVDLGAGSFLQVSHYSLWVCHFAGCQPVTWDFEGSVDGQQWVSLRRHVSDTSLATDNYHCTYKVPSQQSLFQYFRVRLHENNSGSNGSPLHFSLQLCGFELYGVLHEGDVMKDFPEPYMKI